MKRFFPILLLGLFPQSVLAANNSLLPKTIEISSHSGEIRVQGEFVQTTISLLFQNNSINSEHITYRFSTQEMSVPTNLEIKVGKTWKAGTISINPSELETKTEAPKQSDKGLLYKSAPGEFVFIGYEIPSGETLQARFTLVSHLQFGKPSMGGAYQYPALGGERIVSPSLSVSIEPSSRGQEVKKVSFAGKGVKFSLKRTGGTEFSLDPSSFASGKKGSLRWQYSPFNISGEPDVLLQTSTSNKNGSWMYLRLYLPAKPAKSTKQETYRLTGVLYDKALSPSSICTGKLPKQLQREESYFLFCKLSKNAPISVDVYFSKNGTTIKKSSTALLQSEINLATSFLLHLEEKDFDGPRLLLAKDAQKTFTKAEQKLAEDAFFSLAAKYNAVTEKSSLWVFTANDPFSRDVLAFAKKWGNAYIHQIRGVPHLPTPSVGTPSNIENESVITTFLVKRFYNPFIEETNLAPKGPKQDNTYQNTRFANPFDSTSDKGNKDNSLSSQNPTRVLYGAKADVTVAIDALKLSPEVQICLEGSKTGQKTSILFDIRAGMLFSVSALGNATLSTCLSRALQRMSFPSINLKFEALPTMIFSKTSR